MLFQIHSAAWEQGINGAEVKQNEKKKAGFHVCCSVRVEQLPSCNEMGHRVTKSVGCSTLVLLRLSSTRVGPCGFVAHGPQQISTRFFENVNKSSLKDPKELLQLTYDPQAASQWINVQFIYSPNFKMCYQK